MSSKTPAQRPFWLVPLLALGAGLGLSLLAAIPLSLMTGSRPRQGATPEPTQAVFTPGVEGRSATEVCQTASKECQTWTELAKKCEENMRRREAGFMGRLEPFCDQAENYREQVTRIPESSSPGAYNF